MNIHRLSNVVCLLVLLFFLQACKSSDDIASLGSYYIGCDKGRNCGVFDSEGLMSVVIEPEVDSYLIQDQFILGHSSPEVLTPLPGVQNPMSMQPPGYFIVDTQKGTWVAGLTKEQWINKLLLVGIKNPQLRRIK